MKKILTLISIIIVSQLNASAQYNYYYTVPNTWKMENCGLLSGKVQNSPDTTDVAYVPPYYYTHYYYSSTVYSNIVTELSSYEPDGQDGWMVKSIETGGNNRPNGLVFGWPGAFNGCKNLKKIVLPPTIKKVGKWAFYDCSLKELVCMAVTPPTLEDGAFDKVTIDKIIVPKGTLTTYKNTSGWNSFTLEEGAEMYSNNQMVEYNGAWYEIEAGEAVLVNSDDLTDSVLPEKVRGFISGKWTDVPVVGIQEWSVGKDMTVNDNITYVPDNYANGGRNYKLSVSNTQTAIITVTAQNAWRIYGEENPSFEYTQDWGKHLIEGSPELTCNANRTSSAGSYPIVVSSENMKYAHVECVEGTLTVAKAILEITPKSYTIMEGDPLPDFEVNYSGFKNGETEEVLIEKPKAYVNINSSSKPGTYTIYIKGGEADNYSFDIRYGTLIITEAPNYEVEIDGMYYKINQYSKEAKVISHPNGYAGEVVILDEVTYKGVTYPVTSVDEKAFYKCTELKKVSIGKNVKKLDTYAFYGCDKINDVYCFAEEVPETGNSIFSRRYTLYVPVSSLNQYRSTYPWSGFTHVRALPDENVITVEVNGIYYEINKETKEASVTSNPNKYKGVVTIPSSIYYKGTNYTVTSIGYQAFNECYYNLSQVILPNSIKSIDWYAFNECFELGPVNIPFSVESIGKNAFNYCRTLETLTIPASVNSIGEQAFGYCLNLKSVIVEDGVREMGNYAFQGCTKLESVRMPKKMDKIGSYVFRNCSSLKSVKVSDGIDYIGSYWFENCCSLESVTISSSVNEVNGSMLSNCTNLKAIYCYAESVPTFEYPEAYKPFENIPVEQITLYVPKKSIDDYKQAQYWNSIGNIVAIEDITAVDKVRSTTIGEVGTVYNTAGQRIQKNIQGLNILKMSDGTTIKVMK